MSLRPFWLPSTEGDPEIVITKLEKAAVEADEEDSWSEDEEDEEVRTLVYKAGKKLPEAGLEGITKGSKVEVQINITRELKLQVAAREVKQGGVAVRGELPQCYPCLKRETNNNNTNINNHGLQWLVVYT